MRNTYKSLLIGTAGIALCASVSSCEDYLDKAPETNITQEDAFKDFRSFQGYIEEIYNCIPDKEKCYWCPSWNWGDDEVFNPEADDRMTHQADLGNFKAWEETGNWLFKSGSNPTSGNSFDHSLWPHSWYCIRKCNMAIENIDQMVGTKEEKELILGQAYFFRAWWHFELMEYFGGLPYIDKVFDQNDEMKIPRLSYQECAEKVAADFQKAAELLPIDWDNTTVGALTQGKNGLRVNKIAALGYLGKNYLWAGSPLMKNGAQLGGSKGKTYEYDEDYCKKAADAFGELLSLVESGQTQYSLVEFKFDETKDIDEYIDPENPLDTFRVARGIYDHERADGATSCYSDLFYTIKQGWLQPGSTEAIFRGPSGAQGNNGWNRNKSNWNTSKVFGPKVAGMVEHDNVIHQPTGNLIDQYGMANGLPLPKDLSKADPVSGWDPEHPFLNRDPRFYHDIVFDGFKYVNSKTLEESKEPYRYCSLYTGGDMRAVANASRTGYFCQKLVPHQCNIADRYYDDSWEIHCYLTYMRLADVYLMYAEACAAANYISPKCGITAVQAVNKIRKRCGCGELGADYQTGTNLMDEIRRERAVELAFEGFRFNDLQRWLLLTEPEYCWKYSHEFDRVEKDDFYKKHDPREAKVANFHKEVIFDRKFDVKHYWFPLPESQVYLYTDFTQNPGW